MYGWDACCTGGLGLRPCMAGLQPRTDRHAHTSENITFAIPLAGGNNKKNGSVNVYNCIFVAS